MNFLKDHGKAFITAIVAICVVLMVVTTVVSMNPALNTGVLGYVTVPVQTAFTKVGSWVGDKVSFFTNISGLGEENKLLKKINTELELELTRLRAIENENEKLKELLSIHNEYADLPKVAADIVAKDPGNWYNTYIINKGKKDGILKDMAVLSTGGLAGKIAEAGSNYARVVSLIDDASSVSAKSERTGDTGFVRGDSITGLCKMEMIKADADIVAGDVIVTGQLAEIGSEEISIYPPNIIIGTVMVITSNLNGTKTAIIEPFVNFKKMETVLVVSRIYGYEPEEP